MKTLLSALFALTVLVLTITGCGNNAGSSTISNEFLGEYPSMLKNYQGKLEKMELEIKNKKASRDVDALLKLAKERKELTDEYKTKVEEYTKAYRFPKAIPFQPIEGNPFSTSGLKVKTANSDALEFNLSITLLRDIKTEYGGIDRVLLVYFKAIDNAGNVIPKSYMSASKTNTDMKSGSTFNLSIAWRASVAQNFENFAKLVQVSEAEYQGNK